MSHIEYSNKGFSKYSESSEKVEKIEPITTTTVRKDNIEESPELEKQTIEAIELDLRPESIKPTELTLPRPQPTQPIKPAEVAPKVIIPRKSYFQIFKDDLVVWK